MDDLNTCVSYLRTFAPIATAHTYYARYSLGTIRHTSSARTEQNTQQNVVLLAAALTWCENIFVRIFLFFRYINSFCDSFIITKTKIFCTWYVFLFAFTIHVGWNCYINTGVRGLEVAFFKANNVSSTFCIKS